MAVAIYKYSSSETMIKVDLLLQKCQKCLFFIIMKEILLVAVLSDLHLISLINCFDLKFILVLRVLLLHIFTLIPFKLLRTTVTDYTDLNTIQ